MENFPYLITLFLFTMIAVVLYAAKTWRNAEKAFQDNKPSTVRMAAERSAAGKVMEAAIDERRSASAGNGNG